MSNTVSASAPALPAATIIPFPTDRAAEPFQISHKDWMKAFIALNVSDQFWGMDDASLDRAMLGLIDYRPSSVERMVRENGEVLADLRKAVAFLAAIDLRIGASAARLLSQEGC